MSFIIFDFDGTLVDSYSCMIEKVSHLAGEFNFKKIAPETAETLRDLSSVDLIRHLNIPLHKIPLIIRAARRLLKTAMPDLKIVDGMGEVIQQFHAHGHTLGIVTSNSKENVRYWLKQQSLLEYFTLIDAESQYFSKHKLLLKIIKKYRIKHSEIWYIGDETRDIEAGKEAGIKTVAVTWGYNSEQALVKLNPDLVANKPADLMKLIKTS